MSARIKQLDADGNVLQEEDSPELGYDHQEAPTGFDEECGTYGTGDFTEESGMRKAVWKSKFHGAFVLNRRVGMHPTHWLISTQVQGPLHLHARGRRHVGDRAVRQVPLRDGLPHGYEHALVLERG